MIRRAAACLAALAGLPAAAAAQDAFITYAWSWSEVFANTSVPVASPNGVLDPGEGARLALTVTMTPGVGSTITYTPPPGPGVGTVEALGFISFDLFGTNVNRGSWSALSRHNGISWILGPPGTPQPSGDFTNAQAGQISPYNPQNPVVNIWRGTWSPADELPVRQRRPDRREPQRHRHPLRRGPQHRRTPLRAPLRPRPLRQHRGNPHHPRPGHPPPAGRGRAPHPPEVPAVIRATLTLSVLAGPPAAAVAQPSVTYTLTWTEVIANSSVPVPSPNGLIEPGEGARIAIAAAFTPGVGSTITYTPPPPPGSGTVAALGGMVLDLLASGAQGGQWTNPLRASGFALGPPIGGVDPDGTVRTAQAGQFFLPNTFLNSSNPVVNVWRATWNPATYTPREAWFLAAPAAILNGEPRHSSLMVQYGPDPEEDPLYTYVFAPADFGNTGGIPIIPAPATLLPLAAAALLTRRRSRR